MLKPAQLYEEELQIKNMEAWYDMDNMYWNSGVGFEKIEIEEGTWQSHSFVSVNEYDEVIGYISYQIDWESMCTYDFNIISFQKGNIGFIRDVYEAVRNLFIKFNMNKIEWNCYADNPAIRGYRKFINTYGGRECAHWRQSTRLIDGKLHDRVGFEIMAYEFIKSNENETRKAESSEINQK